MRPLSDESIGQPELEQLLAVERFFRDVLRGMRARLDRGAREQDGPLALNPAALGYAVPRLVIRAKEKPKTYARPGAEAIFVLRSLLADADVLEMRVLGCPELARLKRATNRRMYRHFLGIYKREVERAAEEFFVAAMQENADGFDRIVQQSIQLRWYLLKLSFAPVVHKLHIGRAGRMVEQALEDIGRVLRPEKSKIISIHAR